MLGLIFCLLSKLDAESKVERLEKLFIKVERAQSKLSDHTSTDQMQCSLCLLALLIYHYL